MKFPHADDEFDHLITIVASDIGVGEALIEKDYWVTHTLWALHELPLDIWFKGGTSLSKGFQLISRFSEDLDLRIEPAEESTIPPVSNWKSKNTGIIKQRQEYFQKLEEVMQIPDASVQIDPSQIDKHARGAVYLVHYPGRFIEKLPTTIRPFIQLEVGIARVDPYIELPLSSFVHNWMTENNLLDEYRPNYPTGVRCIHPVVTLIEKLDAILARYHRETIDSASFIRHYEDAAHIILRIDELPLLEVQIPELITEMLNLKQIRALPTEQDEAFLLQDTDKRQDLLHHYDAIAPMFWGNRISLKESCIIIREWLKSIMK